MGEKVGTWFSDTSISLFLEGSNMGGWAQLARDLVPQDLNNLSLHNSPPAKAFGRLWDRDRNCWIPKLSHSTGQQKEANHAYCVNPGLKVILVD